MKQKLDLTTWVRREHFQFFNKFDEPYFGVCVNVDCTATYKVAKEKKISFFLYSMYLCLKAAQQIEPFKYRIENDDEVVIYNQVDAGSTLPRSNGTFGFGHYFYYPALDDFIAEASKEVEQVYNSTTLARSGAENIIRFSSLPWIDFTSVSHARMFSVKDSCPRISFGKMTEQDGKRTMPLGIHVNHALMDGLHVGQYLDCLQEMMNGSLQF